MNKRILLIIIIIPVVFVWLNIYNKGKSMTLKTNAKNLLTLKIEVEKNVYFVGEDLKINYITQNISDEDIVFVNWDKGYKTNWIKAYDSERDEMTWLRTLIYELEIYLDKNRYVIIPKGQRYTVGIMGKIVKTEGDKFWPQFEDFGASSGKVKNIDDSKIWIEFDDSLIALKDVGEYTLKGVYESLDMWKKDGELLYNLNNIWTGKIESNEIKINIKE